MKKLLSLLFALSLATCTLTACDLSSLSGILGSGGASSSNQSSGSSLSTSSNDSSSSSSSHSSSSSSSASSSSSSSTSSSSSSSSEDEKPADLLILEAAYALKSGESLPFIYTMTGVVTEVKKTGQGDSCLTFVVGGYTQYPMYCYWLQDADFIQEGDTITVKGTIKNYDGVIEFDHPDLLSYQQVGGSGSGSGGGNTDSTHTYTDFKASEKALFNDYFGEVIPFIPNDEYYVKEYAEDGETGINFYAYGVTKTEFNAYLGAFSNYTDAGTEEDEYGDTWYFFDAPNFYIDLAYYLDYYGDYVVDVYVYTTGNTGGSSGSTDTDAELLKNDGKGLPTGTNGVYTVDFTKATNVKTVADQGYYLGGCPTTGNVKVLVVPVQFKDVTAASKGYSVDVIEKAFNGSTGDTDYYSVREYYYKSSYGKLNLQFDVLDNWFTPKQNSSYYLKATMDMDGQDVECGDQIIIDEVLQSLESSTDLSSYDTDGNDMIDAIVLINTLEIDYNITMQWAYRYWNMYTDDEGYYYEYDGVSANDYLWASYQFLFDDNNGGFDDTDAMNTYTYIHEFGHVLGADDYYDTAYVNPPMDGNDIMDGSMGDHNAYTKFNYGWLTASRLITAEESVTLTLDAFSKNGDSIIIANNWDETLGAYQEYFVVVYYTNDGLNGGAGGYFDDEGIVVYHINSTLYKETYEGEVYYDVYNNNTDPSDEDGYGTENNLIEFVKSGSDYVYTVGDSLSSTTKTDGGETIAYTFTVDSINGETATLTFTKNN